MCYTVTIFLLTQIARLEKPSRYLEKVSPQKNEEENNEAQNRKSDDSTPLFSLVRQDLEGNQSNSIREEFC